MTVARSVMWFRRDLRLRDHPALAAACAHGDVMALFVDDPAFDHVGAARRRLLHECLVGLSGATQGALVIRRGDPRDVVAAVAAEVDADVVFVSRDFSPRGHARDRTVAERLASAGRTLRGVGSPYAVTPGAVLKPDGGHYRVFTPYSRRWRSVGWSMPIDAPADPSWLTARSDPLPAAPDDPVAVGPVTEDSVWERFTHFRLGGGLDDYDAGRDRPAIDGTSRLSPFLKFGVVHPRQLLAELQPGEPGHDTFAAELAWRDFYADVLFRSPESAWHHLDPRFDAMRYDRGTAARAKFERWCAGTTGFPIVDAGMRQLVATGWMHNRVRMITASFLVKDLHLPWTWGARFFLDHLLDGDVASNNHGWQWAAGSGTDAAPYFRVFNPTTQQHRWDPSGEYVDRWVPEVGTSAYPAPMVDHAAERAEALARYEDVKRAGR